MYDRDFLHNLGSVILFAVAGTLFNVFVIGYGLYGLASIGWMGNFDGRVLDSIEALIFSSLISAVDPVSLGQVRTPRKYTSYSLYKVAKQDQFS